MSRDGGGSWLGLAVPAACGKLLKARGLHTYSQAAGAACGFGAGGGGIVAKLRPAEAVAAAASAARL